MARVILEKTELDSDESIISIAVKSLYKNVPLKESVETSLRRLYEQINPPGNISQIIERTNKLGSE